MFKRRKTKTIFRRIKDFIYPDMGLYRSVQYNANRVKRLKSSPYSIAAGLACGVAMSFTPFLGLHFLLSILLAVIIRGSLLASAVGTLVGNPITLPFIFLLIYQTGQFLLGIEGNVDGNVIDTIWFAIDTIWFAIVKLPKLFILDYQSVIDNWSVYRSRFIDLWSVILPMLLGGLIWAVTTWFIIFTLMYRFVHTYQKRRQTRRQKRLKKHLDKSET